MQPSTIDDGDNDDSYNQNTYLWNWKDKSKETNAIAGSLIELKDFEENHFLLRYDVLCW